MDAQGLKIELQPGMVWSIPKNTVHSFHTDQSELNVIAYHPDTDRSLLVSDVFFGAGVEDVWWVIQDFQFCTFDDSRILKLPLVLELHIL